MKLLVTLCFLASLATVAFTRDAFWGRQKYNNYLLYRENFVYRPQRNVYQQVNVMFPKSGQFNTRNITYIQVVDNYRNKSGAIASLWSGGPNFRFAHLNLKSGYSGGINSTVHIYGL